MPSRIPNIAFMTTLGVNVGDEFIREGIHSFLEKLIPQYHSLYVSKHDLTSLHEHRLNESISVQDKFLDADVIIQAGAPVYWKNSGSACYSAEWVDELWRKRIFQFGQSKIVLNIGAGSGQAFHDNSQSVSSDPLCAEFIRQISKSCKWESVRDPLASAILNDLKISHVKLPCPAFHAARRIKNTIPVSKNCIAINFMPLSGHYQFAPEVTESVSLAFQRKAVSALRRNHTIMFIAHNQIEADYMRQFQFPGESMFLSNNYLDYFEAYGTARGVFANRVHGGVFAAGFGRPAVLVGNDSRLRIAEYIGLPNKYIADADVDESIDLFEDCLKKEQSERDRLLNLREESAEKYIEYLRPFFKDWQ